METSPFPKSLRVSTPKLKGSCLITESLEEADVVMFRWLPCPHCGEYQILEWRDKKTKTYYFDFATYSFIVELINLAHKSSTILDNYLFSAILPKSFDSTIPEFHRCNGKKEKMAEGELTI